MLPHARPDRRTTLARRAAFLALVALLASAPAHAQGNVYRGGDGTTTVVQGSAVCGTDPLRLNDRDGNAYSVASVSQFAIETPGVTGSIPNPMGQETPASTGPVIGVAVANPTIAPLTITEVNVSTGGPDLFDGEVQAVKPLSGWSVPNRRTLRWTGSVVVPANSALDFLARVRLNNKDYTEIPVTLSALTDRGTLVSSALFTTTSRGNNSTPAVSLYYIDGGLASLAGAPENGGQVDVGQIRSFRVRIQESEEGNNQPIPVGTVLSITFPPGWSEITVLPSPGFGAATINLPTTCDPGSVATATTAPILRAQADFQFLARAPVNLGSVGIYRLDTRLDNPLTVPPIRALAQYVVAVMPPPRPGTLAGLTSPGLHLTVPSPMGKNTAGVFAVTFANPTDSAITLSRIRITDPSTLGLFKSALGLEPLDGWSRPSEFEVRWDGSVRVDPHKGLDFVVRIQGNNRSTTQPVTLAVSADASGGSVYLAGAPTAQGNLPNAALHYLEGGRPAAYVPAVNNGEIRSFTVAVEETENKDIPAGTVLTIDVPAGWSGLEAASNQGSFAAPSLVEPVGGTPGSITIALRSRIKKSRSLFTFAARAPGGVLQSLYVFPTRLSQPGIPIASISDAVVQTIDPSGALEVRHLSPPFSDTGINQVDIQLVASSVAAEECKLEVHNLTLGRWETLAVAPLDATPREVVGSIRSAVPAYLDAQGRLEARIVSTAPVNHFLHEDQLAFIASRYWLEATALAPPSAPVAARGVALLHLRLEVEAGAVELRSLLLQGNGQDPGTDVAGYRLLGDEDCDGASAVADREIAAASPDAAGQALIAGGGPPLLIAATGLPGCALLVADLASNAVAGNLVGLELADGSDLATNLGSYPVPSLTGYPISSGLTLITPPDADHDGIADTEEALYGTDRFDADSDDDGLLDGEEILQGTDPAKPDTDGDGLPDGLELGAAAFRSLADDDGDGTPDEADPDAADPAIRSTDARVFAPDLDPSTTTDPLDDDSDDDGLIDGNEDLSRDGRVDLEITLGAGAGSGETDPLDADSDGDGLLDGTELGLTAPQGTGSHPSRFARDLDPGTSTSPLDDDSDDDGLADGAEDANGNGRTDRVLAAGGVPGTGETDPTDPDSDSDGLLDGTEVGLTSPQGQGTDPLLFRADVDAASRTSPLDDDSEDDGLIDGQEDVNRDGAVTSTIGGTGTSGSGETDPGASDSDGDGCQDGTESGRVAPQGQGTDPARFTADLDPATTTDPLDRDSDDDGRLDGEEDRDCNGRVDPGEDPQMPSLLRNDEMTSLAPCTPAKASIFTGTASGVSLDPLGLDGVPGPGEGADPAGAGSADDDDLYLLEVSSPHQDPDASVLEDRSRPLVFYQVSSASVLHLVRTPSGRIALSLSAP